jgi:hypothetical protein
MFTYYSAFKAVIDACLYNSLDQVTSFHPCIENMPSSAKYALIKYISAKKKNPEM